MGRLGRLRVVVACAVVAGGVLVGPGAAPAGAAAACTANVEFNYAPGITAVPGGAAVTGTLVLNCPVLSPDAGLWTLPFAGFAAPEACVAGTGLMTLLPGAVGPPGPVAGTFTYIHYFGGEFALIGGLTWPGTATNVVAAGVWAPVLVPGHCVLTPVTKAIATGIGGIAP